jgi:hypothetical protein
MRYATVSVNGEPVSAARTPRRAAKPAASSGDSKRTRAARKAVQWAHAYAALAIVLSACLNGYAAAADAASVSGKVVGALLGASVPVLVWLLAQAAAYTYRAGWTRFALLPGAVACVLLVLSVTHCAAAFAALTGTGWLLSVCLAVGIDCGLVSSEAVAILVSAE